MMETFVFILGVVCLFLGIAVFIKDIAICKELDRKVAELNKISERLTSVEANLAILEGKVGMLSEHK